MQSIQAFNGDRTDTGAKASGFSELSSDEFVKIMFAELANQDPLKPSDSQAMLEQLSSLRSIETDRQMGERLDQMVDRNDFAAASGLIGQIVSGLTTQSEPIIDTVFSVSRTSEGPVLNLTGGQQVKLDDVIEVANPPERTSD